MRSAKELRRAIEALAAAAHARIERHPQGYLLHGRPPRLEICVPVPLGVDGEVLETALAQAGEALDEELAAAIAHRAAFRPGHVLCLRCGETGCEHSAPPDGRQIFAGYGASGLPRFVDFGQWLLERRHPQLDRIYARPPRLVTEIVTGEELFAELVPAFRQRPDGYTIHGQVTAGWYAVRRADGGPGAVALSLQVLSSMRRGRRRLALNLVARGPDGEPLDHLFQRLGAPPWADVVKWAQPVLESIERGQPRATKPKRRRKGGKGKKGKGPGQDARQKREEHVLRRIDGLLAGIARRLQHDRRSRERRTGHGEKRHSQGDRPTRMALADLARAIDERILHDNRRGTLVVLGDRGRAHIFNLQGRLVTSVRYSPESIARKKRAEIWRPATAAEAAELRAKAMGQLEVE